MKTSNLTLSILLLIVTAACQPKDNLTYRYADKAQDITCDTTNDRLLNEALYTFENAIVNTYDQENKILNSAYGRFTYIGLSGAAEYDRIADSHAFAVRDALLKQGILIENGTFSNLNYDHPAVQCIIENISDVKLKSTITALIDTNSMNPKLFDSRLRNVGRNVSKDRYVALYTALDAFYQNLVGLPAPTTIQ